MGDGGAGVACHSRFTQLLPRWQGDHRNRLPVSPLRVDGLGYEALSPRTPPAQDPASDSQPSPLLCPTCRENEAFRSPASRLDGQRPRCFVPCRKHGVPAADTYRNSKLGAPTVSCHACTDPRIKVPMQLDRHPRQRRTRKGDMYVQVYVSPRAATSLIASLPRNQRHCPSPALHQDRLGYTPAAIFDLYVLESPQVSLGCSAGRAMSLLSCPTPLCMQGEHRGAGTSLRP